MSGRKRKIAQKVPKNAKKMKLSDPGLPEFSDLSPWETLPRELWEAIFDSFDDTMYFTNEFSRQPRNYQLEFLRIASKTLNNLCKQYLKRVNEKESKYHQLTVILADRGYFSCLKYVVENGIRVHPYTVGAAVRNGHNFIAKYCIEELKGLQWINMVTFGQIVQKDDVDMLKYAHKQVGAVVKQFLETANEIAAKGSIKCLKYLRNKTNASKWRQLHVCANAAESGSLECLKYLHEDLRFNWDARTGNAAAKNGHFELLQYYHENGGVWNALIVESCAEGGNLECLKYVLENGAVAEWENIGAAMGHLDCLKFLHEHFGLWPEEMRWYKAAEKDAVECYQYAHEHGAPWDNNPCEAAAESGAIKCLKYAHEHGAEWSEDICNQAAHDLACLKYVHEKGATWDESTPEFAVHYNAVDSLKYMHENGCPWDSVSLVKAAKDPPKFECLKYLVENGCPWDKAACVECPDRDIKQYLHEHGCPCDCNAKNAKKKK